jgi:hypothetical protein
VTGEGCDTELSSNTNITGPELTRGEEGRKLKMVPMDPYPVSREADLVQIWHAPTCVCLRHGMEFANTSNTCLILQLSAVACCDYAIPSSSKKQSLEKA